MFFVEYNVIVIVRKIFIKGLLQEETYGLREHYSPLYRGLGMFIYGMQIMAQGLENAAGSKMKSLLEVLTKNKFFSGFFARCF